MLQKTIIIQNTLGLHARASAKLVNLANKFLSKIELCRDDECINAKSIMGIMLLAASKGSVLNLIVDGKDEKKALKEIVALIENKFNEKD